MIGFGQSVIDIVADAGAFKGMSPKDLASGPGQLDIRRSRTAIAWGGEVSAVVSQDSVDLIANGSDQLLEEIGGAPAGGLFTSRAKANLEVRSTATDG